MIEIFNMDNMNDCVICYNLLDTENRITFPCNHTCCRQCTDSMILNNRLVVCPLDRSSIETIFDKTETKTVDQYKYDLWNNDKISVQIHFENFWSNSILCMIDVIKEICDTLISYEEKPLSISKNDHLFTKSLEKRIKDSFSDGADNQLLLFKDVISKSKAKQIQPIEFNVLYCDFNRWLHTLIVELETHINNFKAMNGKSNTIFREILKHKMQYNMALAVSYLSNNGHIYQLVRFDVKEIDVNKCLICGTSINKEKFATFSKCQHKICLDCIETFIIMHGSCPFESNGFENLQISDNLQSIPSYLTDNYKEIGSKLFNKYMHSCIPFINRIIEISAPNPNLFQRLLQFKTSVVDDTMKSEIFNIQNEFISNNEVIMKLERQTFDDRVKILKDTIQDESINDYFRTMNEAIEYIEQAMIRLCKSSLCSYSYFAKEISNPIKAVRGISTFHIMKYKRTLNEMMEFQMENFKHVFSIEIYELIKKLQTVISIERDIIIQYLDANN